MLRPRPYTQPHPAVIRGSSGDGSLVELAREGKPFMMNVQSLETTARRVELYRQTMRDAGFGEAAVAKNLAASWVWRNFYVAETRRRGRANRCPRFRDDDRGRAEMRNRIFAETGARIVVLESDLPGARTARGERPDPRRAVPRRR